jgi:hypothetical protein
LVREIPETSSAKIFAMRGRHRLPPFIRTGRALHLAATIGSRADLAPGRPIGANISSPHLTSAQVTGRPLSLLGKPFDLRPQFLEAFLPHQFLKLTASAEIRMQFLRD